MLFRQLKLFSKPNQRTEDRRLLTLLLNALSSLSTVPAAILAYCALEIARAAIPYVMAFSAASFLYIALADLYPELHEKVGLGSAIRQFLLMLAGIGTMILFLQFHP